MVLNDIECKISIHFFFRISKQHGILSFLGGPRTQWIATKSNEALTINGSKEIKPKCKNYIQEQNEFLTANMFSSLLLIFL